MPITVYGLLSLCGRRYPFCLVGSATKNGPKSYRLSLHSCYGGAFFSGFLDYRIGKSIISSKTETGFTTKGEEEEGVLDTIKSWQRPTIEATAVTAGAVCKFEYLSGFEVITERMICIAPLGPHDAFTHTGGNLATGANPASPHVAAKEGIKAFEYS
ncbi:putative Class I glutamine amidotransferase-like protein [Seiridium unicorne]|uniref:Class I glutamine amidotransferase-like protein n=1 Tax=Seiridium unicorne TaxID=138068 RepID=A0ABR2VEJ0_9PEZI